MGKTYTEKELNDAIQKAFNASKERYWDNPTGAIKLFDGDTLPYYPERFKTFEEYKASLTTKSFPLFPQWNFVSIP